VPVGRAGYHLYVGQILASVRDQARFRLRTLAYAYRVAEGPSFDDPCLFRWEYNSLEDRPSLSPRHHLHLPAKISCFDRRRFLDAEKLHIPSGWVTVEEIIRFLIQELRVKSKSRNWNELLLDSERRFREWTGRSI
jgi:hypothetical protein